MIRSVDTTFDWGRDFQTVDPRRIKSLKIFCLHRSPCINFIFSHTYWSCVPSLREEDDSVSGFVSPSRKSRTWHDEIKDTHDFSCRQIRTDSRWSLKNDWVFGERMSVRSSIISRWMISSRSTTLIDWRRTTLPSDTQDLLKESVSSSIHRYCREKVISDGRRVSIAISIVVLDPSFVLSIMSLGTRDRESQRVSSKIITEF